MKSISLIHPFTPKAAGVVEKSVPSYHSQPHVKAMMAISNDYTCKIEYFTSKWFKYAISNANIKWVFYPVSFQFNGDHKKWKKQFSNCCIKAYERQIPDVTIINMSGHSSPFSYDLSKSILKNNKQYIAMLGGQEIATNEWLVDYYKKANHILVHTHLQKEEMHKMDEFKDLDIRVFPLGVECDVFKPNENIQNDTPKLLYVGKIVEWKRVHLAVEALDHLVKNGFPDASLTIVGPVVSPDYLSYLNQLIDSLEIAENVTFIGHIEHYQLPSYFQASDVLLLPSDKETFGMVMIESMACGTPVAAINCIGGPLDVITNEVDGILSSVEEYSLQIFNLFSNRTLLNQMKANARNTVLRDYSIEQTTKVLLESINSILD